MRATRPEHRAWAGVGALSTLLAIGLLFPGLAQAGCSHPSDRPAIGIEVTSAFHSDLGPADPAPVPTPCDGPQCSGKSAPVPTAVAPLVPPPPEWAVADRLDPLGTPPLQALIVESVLSWPGSVPSPIWHPPRRSR